MNTERWLSQVKKSIGSRTESRNTLEMGESELKTEAPPSRDIIRSGWNMRQRRGCAKLELRAT